MEQLALLKVKNNAGNIIEVTKTAWELLYHEREGFELVKENSKTKASSSTTKKKVKKDDSKRTTSK